MDTGYPTTIEYIKTHTPHFDMPLSYKKPFLRHGFVLPIAVSTYRRACVLFSAGLVFLLLSGCSSFRSHDEVMTNVIYTQTTSGSQAALQKFKSAISKSDEKKLLYALEMGELLRQNHDYAASTLAWGIAETQIIAWEKATILNPTRLFSYLGASTINEQLKLYEGQDYEKTWVSARIALNHLALNNWDNARVAIKRTHEREAIITAFRAKETANTKAQATSKGWNISGKELGGYPIEYIEAPDVLALTNSYQNAFSHYLAGFVYEAINEQSLAAPGYRQAVELNPNSAILQEGLRGLDQRMHSAYAENEPLTDTLFIIESGYAPARIPYNTTLPFFYTKDEELQVIHISVSFPYIKPTAKHSPIQINVGNQPLTATPIMDLNLMARRALRDELPGLIVRGLTRVASKGAMQYYANESENAFAVLFASLFSIMTEFADDRTWRTLPGSVLLARAQIPSGTYPLVINQGGMKKQVEIKGRYAIVPIRLVGHMMDVGSVSSYGAQPNSPATAAAMVTHAQKNNLNLNVLDNHDQQNKPKAPAAKEVMMIPKKDYAYYSTP